MYRSERYAVAFAACAWLSLGLHLVAYYALFVADGGGRGLGEEGAGGGGGEFVEIAVAGPANLDRPQPGVPPQPEPAPEAPAEPPRARPEPPEPAPPAPRQEPAMERPPDPPTPDAIPVPAAEPEPSEASPEPPSAPVAEALEGPLASGTGAEDDSSGRAPGNRSARELILGSAGLLPGGVAEQRSLLPPPMRCDDPAVGVWRARKYEPLWNDWASFVLRVRRDGDRLHGTITSRTWTGGRFDSTPPPCRLGGHDYTVRMRARGRIDGMRIDFGARTYRVVRARCPSPFFDYNPDHFNGEIDPEANEFQSVNNDGGRDVNAPYVFRRTDCDPDA